MHSLRVPPKFGTKANRKALRKAAGNVITHKQIMEQIAAEDLVSWVCVGKRRTGCGGGSKSLRGSHQIGIFPRLKK